MDENKPSIYSFKDFATLFSAYVEWMKGINPKFFWRWLGRRLQLKSHTLDTVPLPQRLFFGYTMPIDSRRIDDAQNLLIEFRTRFVLLMGGGEPDTVNHLGIQHFPTTALPSGPS